MAGYSGTPLSKKLGIKHGTVIQAIDAPPGYRARLAPLPDGVTFTSRLSDGVDVVHLFATRASTLARTLPRLRTQMRADAVVWVSWPKKASNVETDITEDVIRAIALPTGLVDVKVCAVDDVWSGLKLVIRKALRGGRL
jgi:hypothetical protein